MKENLFYELNITEDGYVIGRHNHDVADSVSIIGYTEESKHAKLFCAAPELLEAAQRCVKLLSVIPLEVCDVEDLLYARAAINKATGETK